ncbi:MAG: glycosyltransferase [Lachnospiraceae bacterium]|nr:glycosyltransferase [Lachnospiraceae bacterium]
MDEIAVLIPCYNESKTVEKVIKDFKKALPNAVIYVYNNNSTDNTAELAKKAGAIVRHEYRQGKGNVIRSMFREIDAKCYIMVDGDDTYPAEYAGQMAEEILNGKADMVIGDRLSSTYYQVNKRPMHNMGNRMVCAVINFLFRSHIRDIMTGYRAFSWEFVKSFPVLSKGFEIETEMSIHTLDKNFRLTEIPVEYRDRPEGSMSKLNTIRDGMRVLKTIVALFKDYKPLIFFGILSFLFITASIGLFLPVLFEYFRIHVVPRFPTLIVSGFLMVSGLLLLSCGVILDVVSKRHRQLFELYLNLLRQKREN